MAKAAKRAPVQLPRYTEKEFQSQIIRLAKLLGWIVYHTHDSRRSPGGFPDLVLAKHKVIFAELKSPTGRPTAEQTAWLDRLRLAGQDARLWSPVDWPEIEAVLKGEDSH